MNMWRHVRQELFNRVAGQLYSSVAPCIVIPNREQSALLRYVCCEQEYRAFARAKWQHDVREEPLSLSESFVSKLFSCISGGSVHVQRQVVRVGQDR
eukprot:1880268-Amphidinium_carterae.1